MTDKAAPKVRLAWDPYMMSVARVISTRATCLRREVGAVIVTPDRSIISTGYNGSPPGLPHCTDPGVGCQMEDGHCVRTIHAEANAIVQAAKHGQNTRGCTLYTTASPCWHCFKLIGGAGIVRVVYADDYPSAAFLQEAPAMRIQLFQCLHEHALT